MNAYNNPVGWAKRVTGRTFQLKDYYLATQRIRGLGRKEIPGEGEIRATTLAFQFHQALLFNAESNEPLLKQLHAVFYGWVRIDKFPVPIFCKAIGWPPEWSKALAAWPNMRRHLLVPLGAEDRRIILRTLRSCVYDNWRRC